MAYSNDTKRALRSSFVQEGLSLEAAADKHKVTRSTATRWKRQAAKDGDNWDKARSDRYLTQQGADAVSSVVLEQFVTLFQTTITDIKQDTKSSGLQKAEALSRLSDAYNKTMAAARKGSPAVNDLAVGMDVIKLLADFVGQEYPQHATIFIEILEPFGNYMAAHFQT